MVSPAPMSESTEAIDELISAAGSTTDPAEQTRLLEEVHVELSAELTEALGD